MSMLHMTSGPGLTDSDAFVQFFKNIGLFHCKIKGFEYKTDDVSLSCFSSVIRLHSIRSSLTLQIFLTPTNFSV